MKPREFEEKLRFIISNLTLTLVSNLDLVQQLIEIKEKHKKYYTYEKNGNVIYPTKFFILNKIEFILKQDKNWDKIFEQNIPEIIDIAIEKINATRMKF